MSYNEISDRSWALFGERFAEQHKGWLVTLQSPTGDTIFHEEPLRALLVEGHALTVDCGRAGNHLAHRISDLQRIEVERGRGGRHRGVRLVTGDGEWSLRFRVEAAPETVGMYPMAH